MELALSEEHRAFRDMVERFVEAEMPKDWARELERKEDEYPFELWDKFTEGGFHGLGISEQYGGAGGDLIMQVIAARALSRTLSGLAWLWGITQFAGAKALSMHGTEAQKQRFLPDIAAGKLRAAISLTEPGGGTDVLGAMRTVANPSANGWVLHGEKIWSSQSHVADYLLVLARTDKNVEKNHHGLTLFWVPAKRPASPSRRSSSACGQWAAASFTLARSRFQMMRCWASPAALTVILPMLNQRLMSAFCLGISTACWKTRSTTPSSARRSASR